MAPELRQMRYVVEVAQQRSFTRAAERLHVAQQALSQQVKSVEEQLGAQLFKRTNRGVELTPAGDVFVQEARRALNAADRVVARTQAATRGETGSVSIAYTLTTVYDTLPALVDRVRAQCPSLSVRVREVLGGDIERLLSDGRHDLALCPRTVLPGDLRRREIRREPLVAALGEGHRLAKDAKLRLADLAEDTFELWSREMSPGYYDAVLSACREAGFEPRLDENAGGSTVWGNIAKNDGVGLVVDSLAAQVPRGIALVELEQPVPALTIDLVWLAENDAPAIARILEAARQVSAERSWVG